MILISREKQSAVVTGTAYGAKYYGTEDGRQTSFCKVRLNYGYELDEFGDKKQLYISCLAYGDKADYIQAVTQSEKQTLLVGGRVETKEYNGKTSDQIVVEYVAVQPSLPKGKRNRDEEFSDIDI